MPSPRALLTARDIRPRKKLGQNFLCDPQAAQAIVRHAHITPADTVVEIGAGTGALTIPAAHAAAIVYAIEPDYRLIDLLAENVRENGLGNVSIINAGFMDVDLSELYEKAGQRLIIMGNLPYYLSSQILVRLIKTRRYIERAVLMFQQELADRLTAPPGNREYGRLSVMLRYCAEIKPLMRVKKELFFPRPKVASTVVGIIFYSPETFEACDDDRLFEIIKIAFAKRRKTIRNALVSGKPEVPSTIWDQVLRQAGVNREDRAETLDASDYLDICRYYKKLVDNNME